MSVTVTNRDRWLEDRFVFLSASKPARNLERFPLAGEGVAIEIEEAVVSLARAVFTRGGRLVFGGHPSISPLVASVAAEYFSRGSIQPGKEPVWIFQSEAFRGVIPASTTRLEEAGYARIFWVAAEDGEAFDPRISGQEQCLKSLLAMRRRMLMLRPRAEAVDEGERPAAMVAIGGVEGVVREARLFLALTRPPAGQVFVLRTTGGAASRMTTFFERGEFADEGVALPPEWQRRVVTLEEQAPPLQEGAPGGVPYALLLQAMVMKITGHALPWE